MRRAWLMVGLLCGATLLPGCRGTVRDPWLGFDNQERDIREVRGRVADLRPGMGRTEVALILGAPARRSVDQWVYLPAFRRELADQKAIYVNFDDDRYESWSVEPLPRHMSDDGGGD